MPRARSSESADDVVMKKPRAPRARAVLNEDGPTPAPRKRAPRKVASKHTPSEVVVETTAAVRKAPTPLAAERKRSARSSRAFIVVAVFCFLLISAGVGVGLFDRGAIDVMAVVNERNEKIARGEVRDASGQTITATVPIQTDTRPNGGLQIANPADIPAPAPTPEVATSSPVTATTTETTATTTATTTTTTSS